MSRVLTRGLEGKMIPKPRWGHECGVASGFGHIDVVVDLPIGTYVTSVAVGVVTEAAGGGLTNSVLIESSLMAPDPYRANNTATDTDEGWPGIFADGFEEGHTGNWSDTLP